MKIDYSDFEYTKVKAEEFYKTLSKIYCPYFQGEVSFNSKGLEHLKFINRSKSRGYKDQYMRFKLLHLAPEILKLSRTLQGMLETKRFEKIKIHSRVDTILKPVNYYEFIALIKRNRVKIIVKQIYGGEKFFWSIIPFWGMNQETMSRIFHAGIPEED
jgi:hypothetical protein